MTADNLNEVARWCGGTVTPADDSCASARVRYAPTDTLDEAWPGDVLVGDGTNWRVMPCDEFKRASEQWVEET